MCKSRANSLNSNGSIDEAERICHLRTEKFRSVQASISLKSHKFQLSDLSQVRNPTDSIRDGMVVWQICSFKYSI